MADYEQQIQEKREALLHLINNEATLRQNPNYERAVAQLQQELVTLRDAQDEGTAEGLGLSAEQQEAQADPERFAEAEGIRGQVASNERERKRGAAIAEQIRPQYIRDSATSDFVPGATSDEYTRLRAMEMKQAETDFGKKSFEKLEDSATGHAALYRPSVSPGDSWDRTSFEEPSIWQVRDHLRSYMGDAADKVTEDSDEYKRAADFMYMRAYDKAIREGRDIVRSAYAPTPGIADKVSYAGSKVMHAAAGFLSGVADSAFAGALDNQSVRKALVRPSTGHGWLSSVLGNDEGRQALWGNDAQSDEPVAPEFSAKEIADQNPVFGTAGRIVGYLTPSGAPAKIFGTAGRLGRGLVARLAGEGAETLGRKLAGGAIGGAGGMVAQGALTDVTDTLGTEDFGERMAALPGSSALRALAGATLGGGIELLGAGARGLAGKLRARPGFSELLDTAEAGGNELGPLGGAREAPVVSELRGLGEGQGPVVGAARKAIMGVPERDAIIEPLAGRLGNTDAMAAEASEPIANQAYSRQARALEIAERAKDEVYRQLAGTRKPFTPIYRRIVAAAKERAGGARGPWPFVSTKPLTWLKGVSEKLVVTEDPVAAENMARTNKGDVWPFRKFWDTFVANSGNELDPVVREFHAQLPEDVAGAISSGNLGQAKALGDRLRVVTVPRKGTVQELDMIEPWINDLAKVRTPTGLEPVDRMYRELLQDLYGVRETFPAKMPAELASAAGVTADMAPFVRQPGGAPKQIKGYGAVKKAIDRILSSASDAAREAGLPNRDLPGPDAEWVAVKGAEGRFIPSRQAAMEALRAANPSMTPDEWTATQNALEGYTGLRPQDRAILDMARGTPAEAILERIARRNAIGDPTAALRNYGMPGNTARTAALDAEFGADIPPQLALLNRLGGSRKAIYESLRDAEGRVVLEKDAPLRELMGPDAVRGYDAALSAESLRSATRAPEARLAMRGGIPLPMLGQFGTVALQKLGNVAYPWLRALGSAQGEFPTPGLYQAPRFGRGLALSGRSFPLPLVPPQKRRTHP